MMMMMVSSLRAHPLRMPPLWRPLFASSLSVLFFFYRCVVFRVLDHELSVFLCLALSLSFVSCLSRIPKRGFCSAMFSELGGSPRFNRGLSFYCYRLVPL